MKGVIPRTGARTGRVFTCNTALHSHARTYAHKLYLALSLPHSPSSPSPFLQFRKAAGVKDGATIVVSTPGNPIPVPPELKQAYQWWEQISANPYEKSNIAQSNPDLHKVKNITCNGVCVRSICCCWVLLVVFGVVYHSICLPVHLPVHLPACLCPLPFCANSKWRLLVYLLLLLLLL